MISPLHRRVLATICQYHMLAPGDRVGVAVSGGADSVGLLRILEDLRAQLGVSLCVLHLNHQLRGEESDADETFVRRLAKSSRLKYYCAREDVGAAAKRRGWNLEDAGRRLRYEFFAQIAGEGGATKIATAHTADDQAETVLARIIRGSGLKGLGAIQPKVNFIIRPLIDARRQDLRTFLSNLGQEWREDPTNQDLRQFRARLRHQMLPRLEKDFSPDIVERLCTLSDLARSDESFWAAFIQDRFEKLTTKTSSGLSILAGDLIPPVTVPAATISEGESPSLAVAQRLIRHMYSGISRNEGQPSRKDVDRVIELATRGRSGGQIALPGGVSVAREFDRLVFRSAASRGKASHRISRSGLSYEYEVRLPSAGLTTVSIPELGRSLCLKLIDWPMRERDTRHDTCVLDAERLTSPLVIRNWRPGDAYRPFGRRQPRKLKQMFLAGRVAATERALWPVLTSAGRVAWAERMPVAAEFSAGDNTRIGLQILDSGVDHGSSQPCR
ncbi:MAG TPA: tRNA lysidine(34) synthetase TilS [Candidatus Acidoferrales bacterium]|nr:tRNA lysidine(34) synthetase TilS [Candidatus Acidoferrales bacterium]